ncbi:MAG: ABC transporter permease, partial [Alphaproteobacteria bacterium]|nr:ABC transporter permease [Alphaproteobacteria bacterium]
MRLARTVAPYLQVLPLTLVFLGFFLAPMLLVVAV